MNLRTFYLEGVSSTAGKLVPDSPESYAQRNYLQELDPPSGAITSQIVSHRLAPGFQLDDFAAAAGPLQGPDGLFAHIALSSAVFESEPLANDLLIAGVPKAQLLLDQSSSRCSLAVRLWDVDSATSARSLIARTATLIDRSTHRNGHAVALDFSPAEYRANAGRRLRLDLSNLDLGWDAHEQDWDKLWTVPASEPFEIRLSTGGWLFSWIKLPIAGESPIR